MITGAARSAGIRALRDGVVWRIAADTFTEVLAKAPQLRSAMSRTMAEMLRESRSANISRSPRVIGVLSTGDAVAAPIVDAIATRLGSHGQTAVVAPPVDTTAAANHYGELVEAFSETLDRAEQSNDWVLVVADRGSATSGDDMSSPKATDSWSLRIKPIRRNVRSTRYPGTGPPDHVHVETGSELVGSAAAGLASPRQRRRYRRAGPQNRRPISGSRAGGWGRAGARALRRLRRAHPGRRRHRPIRRNECRCSRRGNLRAGVGRLGCDRRGTQIHGKNQAGQRLHDPRDSPTRGRRVDRLIEGFFGSTTLIEHLPRGFFSVSTDLITGDQIIHRRGLLWVAVRASISIPGLLPPVQHGEQLLVDGGLLNNLPADVMCADPDGEVICVDLRRTYVPSKGFGPLPAIASASRVRPAALDRHGCRPTTAARDVASRR